MNEQVKQLAEQAGGYVSLAYDHDGKLILSGEDIVQKFAELIVRECADLIDNKKMITAPETYDEVFWARYDTKEQCAKEIREHFGVQE